GAAARRHPPAGRGRAPPLPLGAQPGAAHGAHHVHARSPGRAGGRAGGGAMTAPTASPDRVLLANARVVTCSGDPTERPFDGDVLIEGERITGVSRGRAPIDPGS